MTLKRINRDIEHDTESRWKTYKRLEQLPLDLPNPQTQHTNRLSLRPMQWGTQNLWRTLLDALAAELVLDQQLEFLERCWQQDCEGRHKPAILRQLWTLMD
jgi:hypothetical protein